MDAKPRRGLFLTFEGVEGSGKTTQARLLFQAFGRAGRPALLTEEPGGTPWGDRLRTLLLDKRERVDTLAELFLFEAIRCQHVAERILPALEAKTTVVCSRFADATVAYQGAGRGLDEKLVRGLNRVAARGLTPDLTVLIDLPVRTGLLRARAARKPQSAPGEWDRIEAESLRFHRRVRQGYLDLARANPRRFVVLDGRLAPQTLHRRILGAITLRWPSVTF